VGEGQRRERLGEPDRLVVANIHLGEVGLEFVEACLEVLGEDRCPRDPDALAHVLEV
jgi:hypothetical protein